jgi:hypothetical protein
MVVSPVGAAEGGTELAMSHPRTALPTAAAQPEPATPHSSQTDMTPV